MSKLGGQGEVDGERVESLSLEITGDFNRQEAEALYLEIRRLAAAHGHRVENFNVSAVSRRL